MKKDQDKKVTGATVLDTEVGLQEAISYLQDNAALPDDPLRMYFLLKAATSHFVKACLGLFTSYEDLVMALPYIARCARKLAIAAEHMADLTAGWRKERQRELRDDVSSQNQSQMARGTSA